MQPRHPRTGRRRTLTLRSPAERGERQSINSGKQRYEPSSCHGCGDVATTVCLASLSCSKPKWAAGLAPRNAPA